MDSSESFLPCTALEKATDSTEEHQTEVLAALAQVPAKASFPIIYTARFLTGEAGCDAGGNPSKAGETG